MAFCLDCTRCQWEGGGGGGGGEEEGHAFSFKVDFFQKGCKLF